MSSITKLPSGKWRARYYDPDGKQHARHFDKKGVGEKWLSQINAAIENGQYIDPKAGKVTVSSYAASWESVQVSSAGTKRIVDNALRLHIGPVLGSRSLSTVRPTMVQAFIKGLEDKGLSPGTIRGIYHVLTQVFSAAVEDSLISVTPCRRIKLPRPNDTEVIPPAVEDVVAVRDAIGDQWAAIVVTLAGSGLRIGELLGLEVRHIDFLRKTIRVEQQRDQAGAITQVKSKTSRRAVPVGQIVIDTLAAHLAAYPSSGALFIDEHGDPLLYRRWRTVHDAGVRTANATAAAALKQADPKANYEPFDFTAHDLRHFYASALISGGASVKQVQQRLGHASAVITLETYTHLWPGDEDRTTEVIDAALAPLRELPRTARGLADH